MHNASANPNNDHLVPNQVSGGNTQDISHPLQLHWFQPVLCLDPASKFPESKAKPGCFVVFGESSGDALTHKILKEDMKTVTVRSVVRPADILKNRNRQVTFKAEVEDELNKLNESFKCNMPFNSVETEDPEEEHSDIPELISRNLS